MSEETNPDVELLRQACERLSEHFDAVHIFASRHEATAKEGTVMVNYGAGNWFARYGQAAEWLTRQDEYTRIRIRSAEP